MSNTTKKVFTLDTITQMHSRAALNDVVLSLHDDTAVVEHLAELLNLDIDVYDTCSAYSFDKLHYQQLLDDDVQEYLQAVETYVEQQSKALTDDVFEQYEELLTVTQCSREEADCIKSFATLKNDLDIAAYEDVKLTLISYEYEERTNKTHIRVAVMYAAQTEEVTAAFISKVYFETEESDESIAQDMHVSAVTEYLQVTASKNTDKYNLANSIVNTVVANMSQNVIDQMYIELLNNNLIDEKFIF